MRYILIFVNGFIFSQPSDNESPQEISIKKKQADLTEAAQEKVKGVIEQAVENKLHKEKNHKKAYREIYHYRSCDGRRVSAG